MHFHYIYILFSDKDNCLYIGYTSNLKERFKRHTEGFVRATKSRRPVRLIYYEGYLSSLDAKRREKFLKGGKGRGELKIQLKDVFDKIKYTYR